MGSRSRLDGVGPTSVAIHGQPFAGLVVADPLPLPSMGSRSRLDGGGPTSVGYRSPGPVADHRPGMDYTCLGIYAARSGPRATGAAVAWRRLSRAKWALFF